ncbi:unnamed protein product [Heligmosomoides polygyrus]|uniref:Uncharacterized protein n=1 Tax=Heligmosomoides polygyrus TaxID=6339 RepID=A0A183FVT1_HELPZ|nr:unnamed protein product [Heligmosomoides polygyrus]
MQKGIPNSLCYAETPYRPEKADNDNIRKAVGSSTKSPEERLQRWKEFFERMYNHATSGDPQVAPPLVLIPEAIALDTAPTREEVAEAIRLLRNNKAAGIDGVMTEMLNAGGDVLINRLHALLKLI